MHASIGLEGLKLSGCVYALETLHTQKALYMWVSMCFLLSRKRIHVERFQISVTRIKNVLKKKSLVTQIYLHLEILEKWRWRGQRQQFMCLIYYIYSYFTVCSYKMFSW